MGITDTSTFEWDFGDGTRLVIHHALSPSTLRGITPRSRSGGVGECTVTLTLVKRDIVTAVSSVSCGLVGWSGETHLT